MSACKNCGEYLNPDSGDEFCSKTCQLSYEPLLHPDAPIPFTAVKVGGEQTTFETGGKREVSPGKGRFDLIPAYPMKRLAIHYANGAVK